MKIYETICWDIAIAEINDQYYNMKEKVVPVKYIVDIAEKKQWRSKY
jgi:hypothetical protein